MAQRAYKERTMTGLILNRFARHRLAVLGLLLLGLLSASALALPLYPYDPEDINLREKFDPPSLTHPMGTDDLGRDVLARILAGGRVSLTVGLLATGLALIIGTLIGAFAGFYGGWLDNLLMRLTDTFLSFPSLFVLIMLGAIIRDTALSEATGGVPTIIMVIALLSWMTLARLVRATFLSLREQEFVTAARSVGVVNRRLMFMHLLPNALGPILVQAALLTAYAIITESGLSYLGFGIQPPTPSWGNMLNSAQIHMIQYPWLAVFPGLMIFVTVMAINFVGDGLRDAFDPHSLRGGGH
ncbi:MAG: ABC transporter permease [Anaerolineae bacterium]